MPSQGIAARRKKKKSFGGFLLIGGVFIGLIGYNMFVASHPSEAEKQLRAQQNAETALSSKLAQIFENMVETDMAKVATVTTDSQNAHPRRLTSRAAKMSFEALTAEIGSEPTTLATNRNLKTYTWSTKWNTLQAVLDAEGIWSLEIHSGNDKELVYRTSEGWWKAYTVYR